MIDTTVTLPPFTTNTHIGVTVMPLQFDTVRFTPLTDTGRKILRMNPDEYRLTMSRDRGNDIYQSLHDAGYVVREEYIESPDCESKWACTDEADWLYWSSNRPDYSVQPEQVKVWEQSNVSKLRE